MRKIKLRVLIDNIWEYIELPCNEYLGFKDKNGKDIYEGDLLTGGVGGHVKPVEIKWSHLTKWNGMTDGYTEHCIGFNFDEYYFKLSDCEVIGNIYENQDLIK